LIAKLSKHETSVNEYVAGVLDGAIVSGQLVRDACQRHLDDLANAEELGIYFDTNAANQACDFFPVLQHTDGQYAGHPFDLYPWQCFVVWNLFGWKRKSDGSRRFRSTYISVARGNGKSPFAAALILLLFGFDVPIEARAECYTAATKREQAKIVFDQAKRYVERWGKSGEKYIQVLKTNLNIPANGSKLEPLGSDSKNTDGLVIHGVVLDELHAWREQHRELYEKLETAMGKRRQPMMITITTAGSEESDLWAEQYDFSRNVVDRSSTIDATDHFAFIAQIDEKDDPLDESVWPKANPMLEYGVVKIDHLRSMADKAKGSPQTRLSFQRYHTNRMAVSFSKAISPEDWAQGNSPLPDLAGLECYAGFDMGYTDDLSAFCYVFPLDIVDVDGIPKYKYAIDPDIWVPKGTNRDLTREPWRGWVNQGLIKVCDAAGHDPYYAQEAFKRRTKRHRVKSLAFDPMNFKDTATRMANEFGVPLYEFHQTAAKYHEPTQEFLRAVRQGRVIHGGNPVLAWCAQNLVVVDNAMDHTKPSKKRSQDKIDPLVAAIMALSECMFAERVKKSKYEDAGMLLV